MKNKEIISLTDKELDEKIQDAKAVLSKLNLNHTISPIENPAKIRINRRNVAKLLTEVSKRKNTSNN